ncbi:hypothetical protein CJO09_15255, partial [Neopusillimonas maritima]
IGSIISIITGPIFTITGGSITPITDTPNITCVFTHSMEAEQAWKKQQDANMSLRQMLGAHARIR